MKKRNIIYFVLIVLLVSACAKNEPAEESYYAELKTYIKVESIDGKYEYLPEGVLIRTADEERDSWNLAGNYYWTYYSSNKRTEEFALVVLYDYEQIPIVINGKNYLTYFFEVDSLEVPMDNLFDPSDTGQSTSIDFKLNITDDESCHLLSFITFANLENGDWREGDNVARYNYSMSALNVEIKGNGQSCVNVSESQGADFTEGIEKDYPFAGSLQLSSSLSKANKGLDKGSGSIDVAQRGYLHVANVEETPVPFLVLAFQDWEQVSYSSKVERLSGTIGPNEHQSYLFQAPDDEGVFSFVLVTFPFDYGPGTKRSSLTSFSGSARYMIGE